MPPPLALLPPLRLLAMDVDGVLTDGSIAWGETAGGELLELKAFSARDGLGLSLARAAGLEVAWITGRASALTAHRAAELGVGHLRQGSRDKRVVLGRLRKELGLAREQVLYLGDDLNDLPAFAEAGVCVAVADAVAEVRGAAGWVTTAQGGRGAVREVVDAVLRAQGRYDAAVAAFLDRLRAEQRPMQ
jgi:3-deoxy-D-manno-octulosonate 8-phosphate phosphatase (KDO 8-P phosphatase)